MPTPEASTVKKTVAAAGPIRGRRVLERPWLSEKARDLNAENKYVFLVRDHANKHMIKEEVERRYKTTVVDIHTVREHVRPRRFRGQPGKQHTIKKAIVTLKPGEKIEVFPV